MSRSNRRVPRMKTSFLNPQTWYVTTLFCLIASTSQAQEKPVLPVDTLPVTTDLTLTPHSLPGNRKIPSSNELSVPKVALGRKLFFDPILSRDGTVSCASCHQPDHGLASPDAKAIGIDGQVGPRNAPSIFNRTFGDHFFWDGRAVSLEEQALMPIEDPLELGNSVEAALRAIKAHPDYPALFAKAFAHQDDMAAVADMVTAENLGKSLAAFQRTLLIGNSPIDRFHEGDFSALNGSERTGLWLFQSKGGCWKCHAGNNFSDELFHNTGVGFGDVDRDFGRHDFTKAQDDRWKFKTPSLRGVAATAPYMHDGSVKTLHEVVEFYNLGGSQNDPFLTKELKPLELTELEIDALVAYLKALSRE